MCGGLNGRAIACGLLLPFVAAQIQVYLVPHSHCDAGWLLTADQYFDYNWPKVPPNHVGSGGSVRAALDSVLTELTSHPDYRFVWSETIWFDKWWGLQNASTQAAFRELVASGRLEFVGGGYVQSDEATTTFADVIDQTTTGHEVLRQALPGLQPPRHGWQIDMFAGYSSVTPSLWALSGYEAMVLRYAGNATMRAAWEAGRLFEFVWEASASLPAANQSIFAHVIDGNYCDLMAEGFDWENTFKDPAGNPPITPANVAARAAVFTAYLKQQQAVYRGPYLALWGCDFHFHDASAQFGNMSALLAYVNAHSAELGVEVRFATAAEYFDAVYRASPPEGWPLVTSGEVDFLIGWPHRISGYNVSETYQTGAQTSWPEYKALLRATAALARGSEAAFAIAAGGAGGPLGVNGSAIAESRRSFGLVQHHDSVPGTMRTSVSSDDSFYIGDSDVKGDYTAHLEAAAEAMGAVAQVSVAALVAQGQKPPPALMLRGATSPPIGAGNCTLVVYNPLGWPQTSLVTFALSSATLGVAVTGPDGEVVPAQIELREGVALATFLATAVPALGSFTFGIAVTAAGRNRGLQGAPAPSVSSGAPVVLTNAAISLAFDGTTGLLQSITSEAGATVVPVVHSLAHYVNATGGAYILYESGPAVEVPPPPASFTVTRGPAAATLRVSYGGTGGIVEVCYTLAMAPADDPAASTVLIDHALGPLPLGTEAVSRFATGLATGDTFFHEASGMEALPWVYNTSLTTPGNYKPLIHSAFVREAAGSGGGGLELAVATPYTMGSASLTDGAVEVMMLRNLNASDSQGPYPLLDPSSITARLAIAAGKRDAVEAVRPLIAAAVDSPPLVFCSGLSLAAWRGAGYALRGSALASPLPPQITVLSLAVRDPAASHSNNTSSSAAAPPPEVLLRLWHMFEAGAHPVLSQPVTVDLGSLFARGVPAGLVEKSLTLAYDWDGLERRAWPTAAAGVSTAGGSGRGSNLTVLLGPMEIKTFTFVWPAHGSQ